MDSKRQSDEDKPKNEEGEINFLDEDGNANCWMQDLIQWFIRNGYRAFFEEDDNTVPEEPIAAMERLMDPTFIYPFGMTAEGDKKTRDSYHDRYEKWNAKANRVMAIIKLTIGPEVYDDIKAEGIELHLAI